MEASEVNHLLEGQTTFAKEQDGLKLHYVLPQEERDERERGFRVFSIGQPADRPTKCVLLLGETGAGKTTFINAVINYLFGVRFEDSFRLLVKEETDDTRMETESQTDLITAYIVYYKEGMKHKYNFVFIDTPGQADTRGAQHQQDTRCRLEAFLTSDFGVDELNCIGLVAKACINRDYDSQKAVLGEIISLLGDAVPEITHILATFAVDKPIVDTVMRNAGVTFQNVFQFDNGALFYSQTSNTIVPLRWDAMGKQYETFIGALINAPSVSIELLREKKHFDTCKKNFKTQVEKLATLIVAMENDRTTSMKYELQEAKNEGWMEVETIEEKIMKKTKDGSHAHNCYSCNQTCIYPCSKSTGGYLGAGLAVGATGVAMTPGNIVVRALFGALGTAAGFIGKIVYDIVADSCGVDIHRECGKDGCTHFLSEHSREEQRIVKQCKVETKIDENMEKLYNEAIEKKLEAKAKIAAGQNKILRCRKSTSHTIVKLLYHAKRIQELTSQDCDFIEDVACQLINVIRLGDPNIISYAEKHVNILKEAMKRFVSCTANEILGKHKLLEEMLISIYSVN